MIRQGSSFASSTYTAGTPSPVNTNIVTTQFYNLVYFMRPPTKTASVNGAPNATGTAAAPIPVYMGDTVRYSITANIATADPTAVYSIVDAIPAGMTLVTTAGSYTPGMTWATSGGVTTVRWDNRSGFQTYFFTVTVDNTNLVARNYNNRAQKSLGVTATTLNTNWTYHRLEQYVTLQVVGKQISNYFPALADHHFMIDLDITGIDKVKLCLRHNEASKLVMVREGPVTTLRVSEIVPIEYLDSYRVVADITHFSGSTSTQQGTGDTVITLLPGDTVKITVINTFRHEPYFKDRGFTRNLFRR
jgi:uncharacterized repeat protein (TIGR01451 family)